MTKCNNKRRQPRRRQRNGMSQMGTGSVNTKAELGLQVVDYFDYEYGSAGSKEEGGSKHYYWNVSQNLFANNQDSIGGSDATFCRVRKYEVYILPRIPNIGSANPATDSNASAMFTCNVRAPGLAGFTRPMSLVGNTVALATNTQTTNVLPRIDTTWKKVFACDVQKTFQSGTIRPYYVGNNQCLFSMRCLDPATGEAYRGVGDEGFKIRVKVVLHIDQPILPLQSASLWLLSNDDIANPDIPLNPVGNIPVSPPLTYVQMDLKKVSHHMS